jgi:hypothetical protein
MELILQFKETAEGDTTLRVIIDDLLKKKPGGLLGFRLGYDDAGQSTSRKKVVPSNRRTTCRDLVLREFQGRAFTRKEAKALAIANGFSEGGISSVLDRMVHEDKVLVRVGPFKSGNFAWKEKK